MGEAAKISLKAIGKQDTHLLSRDPEESFFNYNNNTRHSAFRKYHKIHTVSSGVSPSWPFGETVRVELNPKNMGDLLNNIWIQLKLPDWDFENITFNETTQRILFGGKTLAEFGFTGETKEEQFRNWWLAGAPNTVGIQLPIFSFPDFKSFLSFNEQFDNLLVSLLPADLFLTIPGEVLLMLRRVWTRQTPGSPNVLVQIGIDPITNEYRDTGTIVPSDIVAVLDGTTPVEDLTTQLLQQYLNQNVFDTLPEIVKQVIFFEVDSPTQELPEIASWAWDMQMLGRKIIKSVKFKVDNQTVEEITADWCIIHDNLYTTDSQKMNANTLYNRNIVGGETSQPSGQKAAQSNELFIHIPFFFSHNYAGDVYSENNQDKAPFPLCAIHNQKITLEIEFFKQSFFTLYNQSRADNLSTRGSPVVPPIKKMPEFNIITEEISLSPEERLYFMQPNKEFVYDFVFKHSDIPLETDKRDFIIQLEPKVPVKCFHWFFRYEGYEDEYEYRSLPVDDLDYVNEWYYSTTANRFNFTRSQIDRMDEPHLLKSAYFMLYNERLPNISNNNREYFFSYTPMRSRLSRSATDVTRSYDFEPPVPNYLLNYIYTYNFALYPKSTLSSGFLDFSNLDSEKTKLHIEMVDNINLQYGTNSVLVNPTYKFHMYYTGYKKLTFSGGFLLQT
jgi:hypothetical protein